MARRRLEVELVGDDKRLNRTMGRAETRLQQFGRRADKSFGVSSAAFRGGALGGLAGGIVGGPALAEARKMVDVASNLAEQTSKTRDVFGQASGEIEDFARSSARGLGLARDQTLELASTFGALLRPVGLVGAASAKLSQDLLARGSDLASFYNTDVQSAIDAIRSGIVGESEPLRAYGVQLSEARVQQVALADTGKTLASQLTTQDKVLARIKILMSDSSIAAGNFEKTSAGLANQSKILSAELRTLEGDIGTVLLPTLTDLVSTLADGIVQAKGFADALDKIPATGGRGGEHPTGHSVKDVLFGTNITEIPGLFLDSLNPPWKHPGVTGGPVGPQADAFRKLLPNFVPDFSAPMKPRTVPSGTAGASKPAPDPFAGLPKQRASFKEAPGLPQQLEGKILDARTSGNQPALLRALIEGRNALRKQLSDPRLQGKAKIDTKQALLGMVGEIQGIYAEQAAAAEQTTQDARQAAEKAKQARRAAREKAKRARDDAIKAEQAFRQSLVDRADKLKSAALAALDRKQTGRDTARALADAKEALAEMLQIGGKHGIAEARRGVEDAKLDRERFMLEQATVTPGRARGADNTPVPVAERGFTVHIGNVTLPGVTNAQELLKALQRISQNTAASRRGRYGGSLHGI